MTINATLTVEQNVQKGSEGGDHANVWYRAAFELGWTKSKLAEVLNQIEMIHGEAALERILDNVAVTPVYSSAD